MYFGEREPRDENHHLLVEEIRLEAVHFLKTIDGKECEEASSEDLERKIGLRLLKFWFR